MSRLSGIVLISGPTGSGKTTTLYGTLKMLNKEEVNISTVENPIEYTLEGVNQVQVNEAIGLTFASALRTFLRQDPDIIMLGEIRDSETAEMAVRASLTGHLVLSTIHTNSAWGIVTRLADMGVPPFLLATTLNTAVAQRLVRLLCPLCKVPADTAKEDYTEFLEAPRQHDLHEAAGCDDCHYTGYRGRKAIYEIIKIDEGLAEHIRNNNFNVREELEKRNVVSLKEAARRLWTKGETTLEEIKPILLS